MADETTNTTQTQQPESGQQASRNTGQDQQQAGGTPSAINIDYDKLAQAVSGRAAAAEEAALKNYLKNQGLTQEEAAQAMASFKEQKARNNPDPAVLRAQIAQANAAAMTAQMENRAMVLAGELGLEVKTVPYVMKLADLKEVAADGAVNDDKLKEAINQVLEDLPQLRKQTEAAAGGFRVGAGTGSTSTGGDGTPNDKLRSAFGLTKS